MSAHCDTCGADLVFGTGEDWQLMTCPRCEAVKEASALSDALERTDQALRAVLAGKPVRDADEILSANAFLLFASPLARDV